MKKINTVQPIYLFCPNINSSLYSKTTKLNLLTLLDFVIDKLYEGKAVSVSRNIVHSVV